MGVGLSVGGTRVDWETSCKMWQPAHTHSHPTDLGFKSTRVYCHPCPMRCFLENPIRTPGKCPAHIAATGQAVEGQGGPRRHLQQGVALG